MTGPMWKLSPLVIRLFVFGTPSKAFQMSLVVDGGYSDGRVCLDYKFEFPIRKCSEMKVGKVVLSKIFTHHGDSWQLEKTKLLDTKSQNHFLKCDLHLVKSSNSTKKVARICQFAGGKTISSGPTATFCHSGDICHSVAGLWSFWIKNDNDQKIVVEVLKNWDVTGTAQLPTETTKSQMSTEVLKWFQMETFGDVTIVAEDGKKFRCHKDILSVRSEVFHSMFNAGMKEARENLVNIDDYSGDVVAQLLVYLYTDDCEIGPIANDLYSAAHQYQLERLKSLCESALTTNLSAESVVKTYRLAKFYHLDKLLAECVDFLDTNKAELSTADLLAEALETGDEPTVKRVRNE